MALDVAELAGAPEEAKAELLANRAQLQGGLAEIRRQQAIAQASKQDLEQAKLDIADAKAEIEQAKLDIADAKAEIEQAKVDIATGEKLLAATAEFTTVSDDGTVALATIRFDKRGSELEAGIRESVVEALSEANLGDVEVEFSQELTQSYGEILGIGEIIGLVSAAVVLYILLGTLIGVALPIFSAVIGVGISASVVLALASEVELTSTTPVLGVMLGLAVGIDYSLFIVNRHRRQLKGGMDVRESIGLANGTSGNAVLFAGLTVVIALVALNLTGIAFIGLMGTMGGVAILLAVAIALTATPAALSLIGTRILSRKERRELAAGDHILENQQPKNAEKPVWATRHPIIAVIATVAVLGILALPLSSMRLGLPDGGSEPTDSSAYQAYTLTSQGFGAHDQGHVGVGRLTLAHFAGAIFNGQEEVLAVFDVEAEYQVQAGSSSGVELGLHVLGDVSN